MESKLRSRKFWIVVATFVAGVWSVLTDTEVDPELIYGYMGVVATWLGVQGWADKAQAGSGIGFERQLYAAQMNAAMTELQNARGTDTDEAPVPVMELPPLESV